MSDQSGHSSPSEIAPGTPVRRAARSIFLVWLAVILGIIIVCSTVFCLNVFMPMSGNPQAPLIDVTIPRGASVSEIAAMLKEKGLIRSTHGFTLWCTLNHLDVKMVAGIYQLSPHMPPNQIAELIALGNQDMSLITIPEGFTVRQIAARLSAHGIGVESVFIKLASTQGKSFATPQLNPPSQNLEGYLFPDTYRFPHGTTERQAISQMLDDFTHKINQESPGLTSRPADLARIVTMASIVEREAEVEADRPLIAGVYYHRLKINMPLDCDATIQYALPQHKSRLLFKDLKVESPYNTYVHHGLPPTPIANPGLPSLKAALHPAATQALFYVAGPTGRHIFTNTMAQHDRVIADLRAGKITQAEDVVPQQPAPAKTPKEIEAPVRVKINKTL